MFLEKLDQNKLIEFAQTEFGKITHLRKIQMKKSGEIAYNMSFRLKANGAYEEAYFYDAEVFPVRVEDMDDRRVAGLNKRYRSFVLKNLPEEEKPSYEYLIFDKELKNVNI